MWKNILYKCKLLSIHVCAYWLMLWKGHLNVTSIKKVEKKNPLKNKNFMDSIPELWCKMTFWWDPLMCFNVQSMFHKCQFFTLIINCGKTYETWNSINVESFDDELLKCKLTSYLERVKLLVKFWINTK